VENLEHSTSGEMTADSTLLITRTSIEELSFVMDNATYVSKAKVKFDADINANLNKMIFALARNSSSINEINFSINGWVQSLDEGLAMDLTLDASKIEFKDVLSMIPAIYSESFAGLKAGGAVALGGFAKGTMAGDFYPAFNLTLEAKDAWFQYPDLPKRLENINIAAEVGNDGKTLDDTQILLHLLSFRLGGNPFVLNAKITHPISDMNITAAARGKLNLGNIAEIYPLDKDVKISGLLDMNVEAKGLMSYIDNGQYEKFGFWGNLTVSDILLKMNSLPDAVTVDKGNLIFNNNLLNLSNLTVKIGKNDISANGKVENYLPYILRDKTLKGNLDISSNFLNISDFMGEEDDKEQGKNNEEGTEEKAEAEKSEGVIIIPKNINFDLTANFKELIYDKMNFTNARGKLKIENGELKIQNMQLNAFDGTMSLSGLYSTADTLKPRVNFDMDIHEVAFGKIFSEMGWLQSFVPVFEKATGNFSTKLNFSSLLKQDMMPDLASILGSGSLNTKSVGLNNVEALSMLAGALKKNDLMPMSINDLTLLFDISDGKLHTKPFNFKVGSTAFTLGGATGLDQSIAYSGKVQLPDNLKVGAFSTVNFKIGGTFTKPTINLDLAETAKQMAGEKLDEIKQQVTEKVDEAKAKALAEAQAQADKLLAEARAAGAKLVAAAQQQSDELVAKASNLLTKKAAEVAGKKLVDEAQKQSDALVVKAQTEADKLLEKAK
ncbi:MAG: AsmA family protein, partial [Paludibacter sp.]|nr:AsmA family protein [Paludibacter sp.]